MPRGNWGRHDQHAAAGRKSSGNRTRGAQRKGGRKRIHPSPTHEKQNPDQADQG